MKILKYWFEIGFDFVLFGGGYFCICLFVKRLMECYDFCFFCCFMGKFNGVFICFGFVVVEENKIFCVMFSKFCCGFFLKVIFK